MDAIRMAFGERHPDVVASQTINALVSYVTGSGLRSIATLAKDAVAEKFKTTTTSVIQIAGAMYAKAAETAIVFSAAHKVSASKFGCILIQRNATGTVSTKVVASPQAYDTAAAALAALPAADAGNVALGYIAIAAKAAEWTANTDDLTDASDLTTATLVDAAVMTPPALITWNGSAPE